MSLKYLADGRYEIRGHSRLHNVTRSANRERRGGKVLIFMNRQEYDLSPAMHGLELGRCLKSIKNRHGDVDHQYIGIKTLDFSDSISPIAYCANDVKFAQQLGYLY